MTIAELKARIETLHRELREAESILENALIAEFTAKNGVAVGDIVRSRGGTYRVTRIAPNYGWLYGNKRLTSGEFGKQERGLYSDWIKA